MSVGGTGLESIAEALAAERPLKSIVERHIDRVFDFGTTPNTGARAGRMNSNKHDFSSLKNRIGMGLSFGVSSWFWITKPFRQTDDRITFVDQGSIVSDLVIDILGIVDVSQLFAPFFLQDFKMFVKGSHARSNDR